MDSNKETNSEATSPDDLVGTSAAGAASADQSLESSQDKSGQDTGEIAEVQAEAANQAPIPAQLQPPPAQDNMPEWIRQISRYHNDMNGLLAGKENLKIMAINESVRHSFYKKWLVEANQFARLTVNLRHRQRRAFKRLKEQAAAEKPDTAA